MLRWDQSHEVTQAQTALDEHLWPSVCESIERRVDLRGVVVPEIKTFALWRQTDYLERCSNRVLTGWSSGGSEGSLCLSWPFTQQQ